MKTYLSSVDLNVLSKGLGGLLSGCRFDKAYSLPGNGLRVRLHASNVGARDLVIYPNFVCVSSFNYPQLEEAGNFAMVLRKHLEGLVVKSVRQHAFERILEFSFEGKGRFVLIVELFSKGNVILCDQEKKIVGLLERQRWKDRTLTPGREYLYPPSVENPLEMDEGRFKTLLTGSGRNLVATLASMGLGGFYAEEICLQAGLNKMMPAGSLTGEEAEKAYRELKSLASLIEKNAVKPAIVLDKDGSYIDVVPFEFKTYLQNSKKAFSSFNDAIDEYFSSLQSMSLKTESQRDYSKELGKLQLILDKQQEALARLQEEAIACQQTGDLIYQNKELIEKIVEQIQKARKQGLSDKQIEERFTIGKTKNISEAKAFKKLEKNKLTLELGLDL
ncbi:MAG: fibronectin-binding domain-containing protein [Candidatus Altiarchaeales archaeon]|nr:fibronectin-binding domain-containing protein [Candidatus Altiarchaeales archaeon]